MDPIHDVTQVSLRQMLTPDRLQGRMNSVFRTVFWGAWPVGSVLGGYVGSVIGPVPAILIGGAGFVYYETVGGGQGACPDADGPSGVHVAMSNTLATPAEAIELEYPLRVERWELRRGSGGA